MGSGAFAAREPVRTRQHFGDQDDRGSNQHGCADQAFFYMTFHGCEV